MSIWFYTYGTDVEYNKNNKLIDEFELIDSKYHVVGIENNFVRYSHPCDGHGIDIPQKDLGYFTVSNKNHHNLLPFSIDIRRYDEPDNPYYFTYEAPDVKYDNDRMQLYHDFGKAIIMVEDDLNTPLCSNIIFRDYNFFRKLLFKPDLNEFWRSVKTEEEILNELSKNYTGENLSKEFELIKSQLLKLNKYINQTITNTTGFLTNN